MAFEVDDDLIVVLYVVVGSGSRLNATLGLGSARCISVVRSEARAI